MNIFKWVFDDFLKHKGGASKPTEESEGETYTTTTGMTASGLTQAQVAKLIKMDAEIDRYRRINKINQG